MRIKSSGIRASLFVLARHILLRGLSFLPSRNARGAERRQALGCSGTRRRASDGGPQAPSGALRPMTRDVRLSALHRGVYGSGPARDEASWASPSASSSRPLVVAEGSVSGTSRELACMSQTRGTPHPALPSQCLAKAPSADGMQDYSHGKIVLSIGV